MRRGYQTRRQFERSLHREPYLAQSAARGREIARERASLNPGVSPNSETVPGSEPRRVCGTCARFIPIKTGPLVGSGTCGDIGPIVASVWSRSCWAPKTVPTDPTNPATILRALVLQQPVERTPDGLKVVTENNE